MDRQRDEGRLAPPAQQETPALPSARGVVAAAAFLASLLLILDLLAGGMTVGALLDAPATGPPLWLVDLLGLAAYFVLLVVPALVIWMVRRPDAPGAQAAGRWRLAFALPLVIIAVLFVALQVGGPVPGGAGKPQLTAFLVAAIAFLILMLGRIRSAAASGPGRLVLFGVLLVLVVWAALAAVERFDFGIEITRRVRRTQVGVAILWAGAFAAAALLHRGGGWRLRLGSSRRLLVSALVFLAVPVAVRGAGALSGRAPTGGDGPNLVVVTFDAMRADPLSLYGGPVPTPHFEALAAKGVVFDRARSQGPHTLPSMTSLFSSHYAGEVTEGSGDSTEYVIPQVGESLAEALRDKGYATCAISANWLLDAQSGILQGFSEQVILNHHLRRRNVFSQALPGLEAMEQWVTRRPESASLMDTSQVVLRYLDRFLGRHPGGPFFVWLHFMDPHDPYAPPAGYRSRWVKREGPWPVFAPHDPTVGTATDAEIRAGIAVLDPDTREYVRDLYRAEVAYADDLLGEVRRMVERASGERPAVWCVAADHGEEFWEHGSYYHGQSLYDELIHVPLVIAAPGASQGLRADEPVALLDVMPTLAELCGVAVPRGFEGRSLAGRVRGGEPPAPAPIFSDSNAYYEPAEAVVSDGRKLVRHRQSGRLELFDLRRDPGEQRNLADDQPEVAKRLARVLDDWRASLRPARRRAAPSIRKEQRERLKSLGYL